MKILETLAKRFGRQASEEVVQVVKTEAKNVGVNLIPVGIGIGLTVIWLRFFKSSSASSIINTPILPTVSTITTNNFFLNEEISKDILVKALRNGGIFHDD